MISLNNGTNATGESGRMCELQYKTKALHLKKKLVISVPFVIINFGTSVHLYNHNFAKFLLNYEAKLTQNKLLTLLYNKIDDLIMKILLLLS